MAQFTVTYTDGTTAELEPIAADVVRFERQYNVRASSLSSESPLEHVLFFLYSVAKRTGSTSEEFDNWIDTVKRVDGGGSAPLPPPSN